MPSLAPFLLQCLICAGGSVACLLAGINMTRVLSQQQTRIPKARYIAAFLLSAGFWFAWAAVLSGLTVLGLRPLSRDVDIYTWIGTFALLAFIAPAVAMALSWLGILPD